VPKSRLVATLAKAKIPFAVDPSNVDPRYTRPRLRGLMPTLAAEGFDSRNLARLASRIARANAALELLVDGAERFLALRGGDAGFDARIFAGLAAEIRIRLLLRTLARVGQEGQAELGKVEALLAAMDRAFVETGPGQARFRFKQTLAGAVITLTADRLSIEPAPPRRQRRA
jgi:tRNA(Ile)-lysidine synthase